MQTAFLELSRLLTGFSDLSPAAAETYYTQLLQSDPAQLPQLLGLFSEKLSQGPEAAAAAVAEWYQPGGMFQPVCQHIILIWYNSAVSWPGGQPWQAPPELYFDALLWKAVEAHPPALSGGYFGYWRYAPEN